MDKLRILPLILWVIYLSSCSSSGQDDPITPGPEEPDTPKPTPELVGITFGGKPGAWQDAPNSRSGKSGLETLFPNFRVWGYKTTDDRQAVSQTVMEGYQVQYTSSSDDTGSWEYIGIPNPNLSAPQTIKYWDYAASSYRFFGYSPFDAPVTVAQTSSSESGESTVNTTLTFPFEYSEDATSTSFPYISELWFGEPTDNAESSSTSYGKNVTLTFAPIIAKVRFKFTYPDNITSIQIRDIKFMDSRYFDDPSMATTPLRGNFLAAYPKTGNPSGTTPKLRWIATDGEGNKGSLIFSVPYEETTDKIHILTDPNLYGKWYYVPPYGLEETNADGTAQEAYAQGDYKITAIIDGNYTSASVPAEYMKWQPGYQYTYTFKITEAGTLITFTDLEVEKWEPGKNIDNNGSGTTGW